MRYRLIPHRDTLSSTVAKLEVEVARPQPGVLTLRYDLTGDLGRVLLPPRTTAARTDELWRHTCFEAFAQELAGTGYVEINLAPSTQWAAYRFDGYRSDMAPAMVPAPRLEVEPAAGAFMLTATLDLTAELSAAAAWRLGLSAVIEEAGGRMSYWALAHPAGKPDFHHADCFALELPPPDQA